MSVSRASTPSTESISIVRDSYRTAVLAEVVGCIWNAVSSSCQSLLVGSQRSALLGGGKRASILPQQTDETCQRDPACPAEPSHSSDSMPKRTAIHIQLDIHEWSPNVHWQTCLTWMKMFWYFWSRHVYVHPHNLFGWVQTSQSFFMLPSRAIRIIVNPSFLVGNQTWTASQVIFTTGKL